MTPISQYKFYDLGAKLHRVVSNRTAVGAAEMFVPLMEAQTALDALIKGEPIQLDSARTEANHLLNKLGSIFDRHFIDMTTRQFRFPGREEVIDAHELTLLRSLVEKFETALASELSRRAVFLVPKRGLFDSYELSEHADHQFSENTLNVMPDHVRADIRLAGRALAFGLASACCFHLIRAVEDILGKYAQAYGCGSATKPSVLWNESLPRLIAMSKSKSAQSPDTRILAMLSDIEGRTRPALQRADSSISIGDATLFFNAAASMLSLMLDTLNQMGKTQQRMKTAEEKLVEAHQAAEIEADEYDTLVSAPDARSKSA